MRVPPVLLQLLALSAAISITACAGASDPPRVPTTTKCENPAACTLVLAAPAGFKLTLTGRSCDAINDQVALTAPVAAVLTTDGCREPVGKVWDYSSPINPAGTEIVIEFTSDQYANPPGLKVTGAYPDWTISFEDGGDQDFNDLVLAVNAVPAA